jgi:hypothetical protein
MDEQTILKIVETLGRLDERSEKLEKLLSGNGQPGIVQRVTDLEAHQNRVIGGFAVIGAIGAGLWSVLEWAFHFSKGAK